MSLSMEEAAAVALLLRRHPAAGRDRAMSDRSAAAATTINKNQIITHTHIRQHNKHTHAHIINNNHNTRTFFSTTTGRGCCGGRRRRR
jgi:hypothetical protein